MGGIVSQWKESMCFANAALAAANLRDNFDIQSLIKEHSYAWMTSSKVPGGCGKGPARECGLNQGGRFCLAEWTAHTSMILHPAEQERAHCGSRDQDCLNLTRHTWPSVCVWVCLGVVLNRHVTQLTSPPNKHAHTHTHTRAEVFFTERSHNTAATEAF